jgi:hypothetical protein
VDGYSTGSSGGSGGGGVGESPFVQNATAGAVNTGSGGGGANLANGAAGGSGVVIIKEPEAISASGVWDMTAVYDNVKAGNWTNA